MEETMSAEIWDHARGAIISGVTAPVLSAPGIVSYQCKLYRAQLALSRSSRHAAKPLSAAAAKKILAL
jgi:hypothetical protein